MLSFTHFPYNSANNTIKAKKKTVNEKLQIHSTIKSIKQMIKKKYQFVDKLPWWMFRNMQHIFVSSNSNESAFKHQDRCDLRSSSFQFDQNASQSNVTQRNTHKFSQTQTSHRPRANTALNAYTFKWIALHQMQLTFVS